MGGAWRILETASLLLPASREAMTWRVGDNGFEMTLSSELPALIGSHVRGWCEEWLGRAGVTLGEIGAWAIHPGGPKILNAAMSALGLAEHDVEVSRGILSRHGNLSSVTLFFLLSGLAAKDARGKCLAIGFGPGLMAEGMLLER
jgi:predicted naringenin-chalcone synthase